MSLAEDLKKQTRDYNSRMRKIDFQVDTVPTWRGVGGYFTPWKNSVTLHYKREDDSFNEYSQSDATLLHEQKHRDNYANGLYDYALSPEQAYKTNMHDEISANMASLVYLRDEYIKTGNLDVFNAQYGRFSFYKEAVQKGQINPFSSDPKDFEKDMALIVNGTRNMWEKETSEIYNNNSMSDARFYGDKSGKYAAYYDENYQRSMKIAYTIGGVDFTKYMDRDVEIPEVGKFSLKVMQIQNEGKSNADMAKEFHLPAYDGSMSLEQYKKLCYHQMVADKYLLNGKKKQEAAYFQVSKSRPFKLPEEQGLKEYILEVCQWTTDEYKKVYGSLSDGEKSAIDALVTSAAQEYAGKCPEANEKAYQAAVDKVYTKDVSLQGDVNYKGLVNLRETLNCDAEIDKNTKLPPEAVKFQNMSKKERVYRQYCSFMGLSANEVENLVANFKSSNAFMRGVNVVCVGIGAPFLGTFERCSRWCKKKFGSDKVENKPINRADKKEPEYRKWENKDGSRVSEVQYRTLPDMTKDVIQKPKPQQKQQPQPQPKPRPQPQPKPVSNFNISLSQVTGSYDQAQLRVLCSSAQRWNQGRKCNAEQYSKAAEITGLPAELIAYVYEVNRKNFPRQAMEADKVINTSQLSDEEIANSVANVLSNYDIEKGAFFVLRDEPRRIKPGQSVRDHLQGLSGRNQGTPLSVSQMQGKTYGVSEINPALFSRKVSASSYC